MTDYGVTSTGFVKKDLDTIKDEIDTALRSALGESINLLATSVLGQAVGILSEREAQNWEVAEAVYNSQYPDTATDASLEGVGAITGCTRLPAAESTTVLKCNLNAGVTLPVGRIVSMTGHPDVRFVTTEEVTNSGGSAADVNCDAECEVTGPIVAAAGTLEVIETPVSGWNSVTNDADAVVGRNIETNAEMRTRREGLLTAQGTSPVEAIRADLLAVSGVTEAFVFDNPTDTTDGDGLPPHSIEAVVLGGTDAAIRECLWDSVAGGIQTYGTTSGTVTDSQGFTHTVKFSRPTTKTIHVIVDLTKDADYPADGDAQVKQAVIDHGTLLGIGDDVITTALYEHIFDVAGVVDVTKLWIGFSDPPTGGSNLTIGVREVSYWQTTNVDVTAT